MTQTPAPTLAQADPAPPAARPRALLLNPTAPELVIRDYYCSKTTKSNYIFQPVDLLMQSGRLAEHYELRFIDAVVDRLSPEACRAQVLEYRPDVIVFLTGAISWEADLPFVRGLKEALGGACRTVASGDIFQEEALRWMEEQPWLDAAIRDFANEDALRYLQGRDEGLENIVYRRNGELKEASTKRARNSYFEMPLPRQELFQNPRYHFSFVRDKPFATVLTDFGCPYPCTFCIMSTLGSKFRSVDSVMEELRGLKRLGVKEIFFIDQTWGVAKERNLELCERMVKEGLSFGWVTYCRVDVINEEVLRAWREAGCHTLIFGVEFADAEMLKRYRKGYRPDQIAQGLKTAQALGIRTVGTFILGLPEDTRDSIEATIELACDLPLDFASFNVAVPRYGTPLRGQAKGDGLIGDLRSMDQAGGTVAMPTRHLTQADVQGLKRKAIFRFYLRPSFLWRRLTSIRSWWELKSQLAEGWALLRRQ
jgi:anaerobic magnesium-protoporphyrin IX monomethyl ester cyclase